VYDQNLAAAQLLSPTELIVTDHYDKTRALIVNTMQVLSQAKEEHISFTEKDKAEKIRKDEEEIQTLVEENVLDSLSFRPQYYGRPGRRHPRGSPKHFCLAPQTRIEVTAKEVMGRLYRVVQIWPWHVLDEWEGRVGQIDFDEVHQQIRAD
jgi:hypothetical protein